MKMKLVPITSLVIAGALCACNASDALRPNTSSVARDAEMLRTVYHANMQYLGTYVDHRGIGVSNRDALLSRSVEFYGQRFGRGSETFRAISAAASEANRQSVSARLDASSIPLSSPVQSVVDQVAELTRTSTSYSQFREGLDRLQAAVLAESWSESDQRTAVSYLVLLGETMDFAVQHRSAPGGLSANRQSLRGDLVPTDGEMYDSWWKCLAGVTGGAILGGLTGAAAGSVLPALGTTAGGVVGAIGGALAGAGSSC